MNKFLNVSANSKWLMGEKDLLSFFNTYETMVQTNNLSDIDMSKIDSHIESHIPVKLVDSSNLGAADKEALSLSVAAGNKKGGKVAIIEMFGTFLTRWDWFIYFYGGVAMDRVVQILDMLEADAQIDGVVFHIDSGGGALAGTELLGKRIAKFSKPTVAYCDNAAHSAAYWVASQCDSVMSASLTTYMGSIGVLMRHVSRAVQLENEGLEVTYVTAPQSTKKVKAPENKALSEEDFDALQAMLKQDADVFIGQVKKGRGSKVDIDAVSNADIFNSKKAKSLGLHDGIASDGLTSAIKKVMKLAKDGNSNSNKSVENNTEKSIEMKFANINIEGKNLSVLALATNNKLVLVKSSSLKELDDKLAGVELGSYDKKSLNEPQFKFESLGIEAQKASVVGVLTHSNDAFVLVDSEQLAGLETALVQASAEETAVEETTETVVEETVEESTEAVVEETVIEETAEETVVEETAVEETTEEIVEAVVEEATEEVVEETVEEVVAATTDTAATSNISPEITAMMDELRGQMAEFKATNTKLAEERDNAIAEKERITANANKVQKKLGKGKLITAQPDNGEENESFNLGNSDARANNASMAAMDILKERKQVTEKVYNKNNQMDI